MSINAVDRLIVSKQPLINEQQKPVTTAGFISEGPLIDYDPYVGTGPIITEYPIAEGQLDPVFQYPKDKFEPMLYRHTDGPEVSEGPKPKTLEDYWKDIKKFFGVKPSKEELLQNARKAILDQKEASNGISYGEANKILESIMEEYGKTCTTSVQTGYNPLALNLMGGEIYENVFDPRKLPEDVKEQFYEALDAVEEIEAQNEEYMEEYDIDSFDEKYVYITERESELSDMVSKITKEMKMKKILEEVKEYNERTGILN